ncbi:hypothetical protein MEQU1_000567 [Malassezia equina]|uniref:Uncharacterized protein n=1 Tax=Malassezia equina TaxID=1381935 RepID=A0AAF0IYY8_9BASI|nr:hypothetical protein MEQU1_000567 [Malassezia equina]
MDSHGPQPLRSRRYGTIMDPPPQIMRSVVDDLGSSVAVPPADAFAVPVTQSKAHTLLAAMDAHGALEDEAAWTDSEPETSQAVRDLLEEGMHPPRSFLTEMQGSDERPWLEALQEEFPNIRRVPLPTVDDEEDEEAPRTIPTAPHVRTMLQAMSTGAEPPADEEPLTEIPVTEAAAAAMERLTQDEEEPLVPPVPKERRKKVRSKAEYGVGPEGELVRKKKKKKDVVRKKKKRSDTDAPLDLRHEPLADLPPGVPSVDEPAESEFGAPMPFLDAVPRPAGMPVTQEREAVPPAPTPPSPVRSLALTEAPAPAPAPSTPEQSRARVLNYNATRMVVNMYVVYWGMLAMLRRVWRWENPYLTGGTAAFYMVVWWRGDLLAVGFLLAFLYVATFRLWLIPPEADEVRRDVAPSGAVLRQGETLGLITMTPSREMLQQVSDHVLVVSHGLADVQERVKNLLLWRSPMVTMRYLGWLLLLSLLSMQVTSWMLLRLPGALLFVIVFILAPLVEYGHWHKLVELLCDVTGAERPRPDAPYATTRTILDNVLAGVPTDEEFLHEKLLRTHWEAERELRRRGQWVEPLNQIVEEIDGHRASLTGRAPEPAAPRPRQHEDASYTSPRPHEESSVWAESMPLHSTVRATSVEPAWAMSPKPAPAMPVRETVWEDGHSVSDYGSQEDAHWQEPEPMPVASEPRSPEVLQEHVAPMPWSAVGSPGRTSVRAVPVSVPSPMPGSPYMAQSPAPPITTLFSLQSDEEAQSRVAAPFTPPATNMLREVPRSAVPSPSPPAPAATLATRSPTETQPVLSPPLRGDAHALSPVVDLEAPARSNDDGIQVPVASPTMERSPMPALHTPELDEGVYLAVHRKRLGHLLVLPTRVVFLLSYAPRQPDSVPGLTTSQALSLSRTVDGRLFYPTIAPRTIMAMVRDEMHGQGRTSFLLASGSLPRQPMPNHVLFDVPMAQVTGLKKLRKAMPMLDDCHEGLELVLASSPGLSMPAIVGRDAAFKRVLSLDPSRWA